MVSVFLRVVLCRCCIFYGNLFHGICDCFGHFVVILRLLVYHFVFTDFAYLTFVVI